MRLWSTRPKPRSFVFEAVSAWVDWITPPSASFTDASLGPFEPWFLEHTHFYQEAYTQECIQGSSQSKQYHIETRHQEEQYKELNARIDDQATGHTRGLEQTGVGLCVISQDPKKCILHLKL